MLVPDHEQLYAFTRTLDDVRLAVVANLSDRDGLVPTDEGIEVPDGAEVVLTNEDSGFAPDAPLGPWAARVLRSRT
jgi:oligo-1,6-glucosidase